MDLSDRLEPPPPGAPFAITNVIGGGAPNAPGGHGAVLADLHDHQVGRLFSGLADARAVLWIADGDGHRHFWCGYDASDIALPSGTRAPFRVRRARLGFEAGWMVSIVWGSATWSTNRDTPFSDDPFTETPATVELAVLDRAGTIITDDPLSYVSPELAVAVIDVVASLPTDHPTAAELIGCCQ